jgi:hypothetical protein
MVPKMVYVGDILQSVKIKENQQEILKLLLSIDGTINTMGYKPALSKIVIKTLEKIIYAYNTSERIKNSESQQAALQLLINHPYIHR